MSVNAAFVSFIAVTNVGLGLSLFSTDFTQFGNLTLLWIFIGYIIFTILLHIIMYTMSKASSRWKTGASDGFAVKVDKTDTLKIVEKEKSDGDKEEEEKKRKEPSSDSPFRWLGLMAFVTVTVLVVFVLVVLVALPR